MILQSINCSVQLVNRGCWGTRDFHKAKLDVEIFKAPLTSQSLLSKEYNLVLKNMLPFLRFTFRCAKIPGYRVKYSNVIENDGKNCDDSIVKIYSTQQSRSTTTLLDSVENVSSPTVLNRSKADIWAIDNFYSDQNCAVLRNCLQRSDFQYAFVSPGERKFTADLGTIELFLGETIAAKLSFLKAEMQKFTENITSQKLTEAGSILSWLSPPSSEANVSPSYDSSAANYSYWSAHCDKENNPCYDYSVLLYLNRDFEGGDLVFMDDMRDFVVQPKAGRLLMFSSSMVNIHRVTPVHFGNRFLLSVWYSVDRVAC